MIEVTSLDDAKSYDVTETEAIFVQDTGQVFKIVSSLDVSGSVIPHNTTGYFLEHVIEGIEDSAHISNKKAFFEDTPKRIRMARDVGDFDDDLDLITYGDFDIKNLPVTEPSVIVVDSPDLNQYTTEGDYLIKLATRNGSTPPFSTSIDAALIRVDVVPLADSANFSTVIQTAYPLGEGQTLLRHATMQRTIQLNSAGNVVPSSITNWYNTVPTDYVFPTSNLKGYEGYPPANKSLTSSTWESVISIDNVKIGWYMASSYALLSSTSTGYLVSRVTVNDNEYFPDRNSSHAMRGWSRFDNDFVLSDNTHRAACQTHYPLFIGIDNSTVEVEVYSTGSGLTVFSGMGLNSYLSLTPLPIPPVEFRE